MSRGRGRYSLVAWRNFCLKGRGEGSEGAKGPKGLKGMRVPILLSRSHQDGIKRLPQGESNG